MCWYLFKVFGSTVLTSIILLFRITCNLTHCEKAIHCCTNLPVSRNLQCAISNDLLPIKYFVLAYCNKKNLPSCVTIFKLRSKFKSTQTLEPLLYVVPYVFNFVPECMQCSLRCAYIYSRVHKYFVSLPLYTTTMDFSWSYQSVIEV